MNQEAGSMFSEVKSATHLHHLFSALFVFAPHLRPFSGVFTYAPRIPPLSIESRTGEEPYQLMALPLKYLRNLMHSITLKTFVWVILFPVKSLLRCVQQFIALTRRRMHD